MLDTTYVNDALFGRYELDFGTRTTNENLGLWPLYDTTHNQFLTYWGTPYIFSRNSQSVHHAFLAVLSRLSVGRQFGAFLAGSREPVPGK